MSWDRSNSAPLSTDLGIFDPFGDREWQLETPMKVPRSDRVWNPLAHPPQREALNGVLNAYVLDDEEEEPRLSGCRALVSRLEQCLREAKLLHLPNCSEVLLPQDLFWRIADQVLEASEHEPCGLRGGVIYVHLQDAKKLERRRVGAIRCDPGCTVATFEIHLTLFQDADSWWTLRHLIPDKLLRSLGRRSSLVVSSHFLLDKKKLYRSNHQ